MELLDVLDENENYTGMVEDRKKVHEQGLWHMHVGAWIMNEKGEILLEQRASNKKVDPNKWARIGGHVNAGETPLQAIQREILEEIGVEIPIENFEVLEIDKADQYDSKKNRYNRYFSHSYFAFVKYKIEEYKVQKEEVNAVKYITIEDMIKANKEKNMDYVFSKWDTFDRHIDLLKRKRNELLKLNRRIDEEER